MRGDTDQQRRRGASEAALDAGEKSVIHAKHGPQRRQAVAALGPEVAKLKRLCLHDTVSTAHRHNSSTAFIDALMAFDPFELRRMRQAAGISLPELARILDIDHGYLSRLERGQGRANAPLAAAWAEACGHRMVFVPAAEAGISERMLDLSLTDRSVVERVAGVLPALEPAHRATLLQLLDLWEQAVATGAHHNEG